MILYLYLCSGFVKGKQGIVSIPGQGFIAFRVFTDFESESGPGSKYALNDKTSQNQDKTFNHENYIRRNFWAYVKDVLVKKLLRCFLKRMSYLS